VRKVLLQKQAIHLRRIVVEGPGVSHRADVVGHARPASGKLRRKKLKRSPVIATPVARTLSEGDGASKIKRSGDSGKAAELLGVIGIGIEG